jgi:hypothetical protein
VERTARPTLRRSRTLSLVRPTSDPMMHPFNPIIESPRRCPSPAFLSGKRRPQSIAFSARVLPLERLNTPRETTPSRRETIPMRPSYANASVQTDPEPMFLPPSSQDDRSDTSSNTSRSSRSGVAEVNTPATATSPAPNPVVMGRMLDYFNAPRYQLGDALRSTYSHQPMYPEHELYQIWRSVLDRRRTV